jgi:capsular exopolysaccharide synthesis family protein
VRESRQEPRDLRYYLRLVWKRKWLLLAVIVLIPVAVYFVSKSFTSEYKASATVQVQQTAVPSALFSGGTVQTDSIEGTARLIKTTAVARRAAKRLGKPTTAARSLLGKISVDTQSTTGTTNDQFLTITATDENPKQAARIANAFAGAISDQRAAASIADINRTIRLLVLQDQGGGTVGTTKELETQLQQLRALRAAQASTTKVIEPAVPPSSASSPKPLRNTAVAFVLALLIAAALIPLIEQLDRRIRAPEELDELLDTDTLATIPEAAFKGRPDPAVREAFQTLRATLTYFNVDRKLNTVMVTSAIHGEGKTTVATNLAVVMAEDGRDIVLIDGDMRHPKANERLSVGSGSGLDSVLMGERSVEDALIDLEVAGTGRLRLLPGGQGANNPAVLFGSARMHQLLDELGQQTDLVLLDTPPILTVSDAIPLLEKVSGVVLIARMDYSSRDALSRMGQIIENARGTLLGVVATAARVGALYGHYAYYMPGENGTGKRGPFKRIRSRFSRNGAGPAVPAAEPAEADSAPSDPQ